MKKIITFFFLQAFSVLGQVEGHCYHYSERLIDGVGDRITFLDSTFEYEFVQGLAGGTVKGNYTLSGDTIVITSEYQADNYILRKSSDTTLRDQDVHLRIKQIKYSQTIEVQFLHVNNTLESINGKTIWHSKNDWLSEELDTVITAYTLPFVELKTDKLGVIIWRKDTRIMIPLDRKCNTYTLDLTNYPNQLDYQFFKRKKALIIEHELCFLDTKNVPEKYHPATQTKKGIRISKKKKIKMYKQCM